MIELSGYSYTCSAGETFDLIALNVYGDEKYAADLIKANPRHAWTMFFTGGEILSLPVVEVSDSDEGTAAPSTAPWKEA